jgi:hypothetical protein
MIKKLTEDQQTLIDRIIELGEFSHLEDGFLYWFPTASGCAFSEHHLRTIALYLEIQNQPLSDSLDEYFQNNPAQSFEVGPDGF